MKTFLEWIDPVNLNITPDKQEIDNKHTDALLDTKNDHFLKTLPLPKLSIQDRDNIKQYSGMIPTEDPNIYENGSHEMNMASLDIKRKSHLRVPTEVLANQHKKSLIKTAALNNTLDKFPAPSEPLTVYSGTGVNPQNYILHTGGLAHIPCFTSSSLDPRIARGFATGHQQGDAAHMLRIHIKPGQHVGGFIHPLSKFDAEKEFLAKSNQMLLIHPNPSINGHYIDERTGEKKPLLIWDAHYPSEDEIQEHIKKHPNAIHEHNSHKVLTQLLDKQQSTTSYKDKIRW